MDELEVGVVKSLSVSNIKTENRMLVLGGENGEISLLQ